MKLLDVITDILNDKIMSDQEKLGTIKAYIKIEKSYGEEK